MAAVLLEARPFRPFKSSEEYLIAMKEDLAEWLNALYPELNLNVENFLDVLETGVPLCIHANNVRKAAADYVARRQARMMSRSITSSLALPMSKLSDVAYRAAAKPGTFFARDNVSNFISWCRNSLGIIDCLLFETDDLILRKNERNVILCLLEVARRGAKFGMLMPMLVQMERQIDREIAAENKAVNGATNEDTDDDCDDEPCLIYGPQPQIVTNDLKSLDEMVRELVERCTCPTQYPMIRVSEGKYRIGDTKVLIFVRILRSHVMVRVGGGWDTLSHYLDKHDPCRCRTSHRSMISAKLIQKAGGSFDLGTAQVHYERSPPRTRRGSASNGGCCQATQNQKTVSRSPTPSCPNSPKHNELKKNENRSRSPTPQRKQSPMHQPGESVTKLRSRSPTPKTTCRPWSPTSKIDGPKQSINKTHDAPVRRVHDDQFTKKAQEENRNVCSRNHDIHDLKKESHQEVKTKEPFSEEFTKRFTVEGGVARRIADDTPKYEPTIYNYKCTDESNSNSPSPSPPAIKEEPSPEQCTQFRKSPQPGDGEHSDNGSEVSDEGYRSLGAVQPPPAAGFQTTQTVVDAQKQQPAKVDAERSCVETDSIETGLRKTGSPLRGSPSRSSGDRTPRANSIVREGSNVSRASNSSRGNAEVLSSPEASPLKMAGAARSSIRKVPANSSCGANRTTCVKNTSNSNTWNGRQTKQRSSIKLDTFSTPSTSFSRKNSARMSLPRYSTGPQYDRNGRRIRPATSSLQSSPTKTANPLLEQIMNKVGHLQDDKEIVQKLQDLLKDYKGKDSEEDSTMEFTRAWIDGNGTVALPSETQVVASPRKDPKPDPKSGFSRIPAPVYKRSMSIASNKV